MGRFGWDAPVDYLIVCLHGAAPDAEPASADPCATDSEWEADVDDVSDTATGREPAAPIEICAGME